MSFVNKTKNKNKNQKTMATPLYSSKLSKSKFKNWIKAALGVHFTKEGIEPFVYDEIEQFQQKCLNKICNNNRLPAGTTCSGCCTENVIVCPTNRICNGGRGKCKFHRNFATQYLPSGCPNMICHNIKSEIQNAHRFYSPSYKNTDATQWCSNPWEVAKCFMPPGDYKDVTVAADTDFNGIISVIINNKAFHSKVKDNLSKNYNVFEQAREVGRAVRHSPNLEVEDTDLQTYFSTLQSLLSDPAYLSGNTDAQNAKTKLLQLQNDTLVIGTDDVRKVLDDVAKASQDKIRAEIDEHNKEAEKKKIELINITNETVKANDNQGKVSIAQLDKALKSAIDKLEKQTMELLEKVQSEADIANKQIEECADKAVNKLEVAAETGVKQLRESADKGVNKLEVEAEAGVLKIYAKADEESATANKEDKHKKLKEGWCPVISSDNFRPRMNQVAHNPDNNPKDPGCIYRVTAEECDKVLLKKSLNTHIAERSENVSQNILQLYFIYLPAILSQRCISEHKPCLILSPYWRSPVFHQSTRLNLHSGNDVFSSENLSFLSRDRLKTLEMFHDFVTCSCAQKACKKMETGFCDTCQVQECLNNPLFLYSRKSVLPSLRTYPQTCFLQENEKSKHKQLLLFSQPFLIRYVTTSETEKLEDAFNLDHGLIVNECLLDILSSPNSCAYLELEIKNIKKLYIYTLNSSVIISVKIFLAWLKRSTFKSLENKTVDKDNCIILWYLVFLKLSLYSPCLKATDKSPESSRKMKDILSDNGPEVSLHAPANTNASTESREIIDMQHNSSSQETREGSNTRHSDENISLVQPRKPFYGMVDLKSQRSSHDTEQQDDSVKKDDEKSDLIKNAICGGLAYANINTDIVTAPAFTDQRKNKKPTEKSKRDQTDVTSSGADFAEQEKSEDNNNAVSSRVDNVSALNEQVSDIPDEVSADGHTPSEASGYTPLDEKSPRNNNIQSQLKHGNQIDGAPSLPLHQKEIAFSVQTAVCDTEGSSSYSSGHSPVIHPRDLPNPTVDQADIQRFEPLMQIIDKIADGERVPPQITMRYEMLRFCTLRSFPKENKPYITRLAQAGFYYANSSDEVVCYSCARRKSNWREDDIPMDIHRQLNPNCKFLLRNSEVNVPIRVSDSFFQNSTRPTSHQNLQNGNCTDTTSNAVPLNTLKHSLLTTIQTSSPSTNIFQRTIQNYTGLISSSSTSTDTVPSNGMPSRAHGNFVQTVETSLITLERQSHHATVSSSTFDPSNDGSSTPASQNTTEGANRSSTPKYPKYASKTVRVTSFNDCGDIVIPPDNLADSGFFYAGFGDCVRCFQCGVGLRHWSEEDDPWIEHSRWSKDCAFVRQMRGQEFVNLVQMAVQYSQNQNANEETPGDSTTGTNQEAPASGDIDNLMHTDAAQSVLEMGYNPNIIRRAIRAIREINDHEDLTAISLMEKIFALEEADNSANSHQNVEPLQQSFTSQSTQVRSELSAVGTTVDNNTTRNQRPAAVNSAVASNDQMTQAAARDDTPSMTTHSGGPEMTRALKKSQLLEQKKLKEENEKLKQQSICTKCRQNDVCIVFLPCGHLVTCETCAPTVRYCTVEACGKYIKGTVRTYLA